MEILLIILATIFRYILFLLIIIAVKSKLKKDNE